MNEKREIKMEMTEKEVEILICALAELRRMYSNEIYELDAMTSEERKEHGPDTVWSSKAEDLYKIDSRSYERYKMKLIYSGFIKDANDLEEKLDEAWTDAAQQSKGEMRNGMV